MRGMKDAATRRLGRLRHIAMTLPNFSGVLRVVKATDLVAVVPFPADEVGVRRFWVDTVSR